MAELQRFLAAPCLCVKDHTPRPEYTEGHHLHPKAEQLAVWGEVRDRELVPLCPTSHRAVHACITAVLSRRRMPVVNAYVREQALIGVGRIIAGRAGK